MSAEGKAPAARPRGEIGLVSSVELEDNHEGRNLVTARRGVRSESRPPHLADDNTSMTTKGRKMSTPASLQDGATAMGGLHAFVTRHPVATLVIAAHVGLWGSMTPVLFLGVPPRAMSAVGAIVGLAIPALLLAAAVDGKPGVRDLLTRTLRWQVARSWYLFAVLALPCGALVLAPLFGGAAAVAALGEEWRLIFVVFLPQVVINLVTVQIFEELAWTGFAQHRMQAVRGALKASVMLGLAFATVHSPMYLIGVPLTAENVVRALALQLIVVPLAILIRMLLAWTYNNTGFSILMAAVLHASFNATNDERFLPEFVSRSVAMMLPLAVVVVLSLVVLITSRRSLGFRGPIGIPLRR